MTSPNLTSYPHKEDLNSDVLLPHLQSSRRGSDSKVHSSLRRQRWLLLLLALPALLLLGGLVYVGRNQSLPHILSGLYSIGGWDDLTLDPSLFPTALPPLPLRCPVYTYYEDVGLKSGSDLEMEKILMWKSWYYSRGWYPIVLNQTDALLLPNASSYEAAFRALPTVNPKEYEVTCYLRWMALAQVGGGLFLDYDILDFSFSLGEQQQGRGRGRDKSDPQLAQSCDYGRLTTYMSHRPMITHGNRSEIMRWVDYMANYQPGPDDMFNGQRHVSDMTISLQMTKDYSKDIYAYRPHIPWVHFSHATMHLLKHYATASVFVSRMMQLHFLFNHRVVVIGGSRTGELLARGLSLCGTDQFTEVAEIFCDLDYGEVKEEPQKSRIGLCKLISPWPWKMSQVACQYERGIDSLALPLPRIRMQQRLATAYKGTVQPFVIGVLLHPVARVYQQLTERGGVISEERVRDVLRGTPPNPSLWHLTRMLPDEAIPEQRWRAALDLLIDQRKALILTEEDLVEDEMTMRRQLALAVGFPAHSMSDNEYWDMYDTTPTHLAVQNAMTTNLSSYLIGLIQSHHSLDIALYQLVRQRWAQRQAEWAAVQQR